VEHRDYRTQFRENFKPPRAALRRWIDRLSSRSLESGVRGPDLAIRPQTFTITVRDGARTMPHRPRSGWWIVLAPVAGTLLACASPCREYDGQTGSALARARDSGAEVFAPARWAGARKLADQATAECRRQESRLPGLRSFRPAEELHAKAREEAERARAEAVTNQGILRQEALNARYRAGMMLAEAKLSLGARSGRPDSGAPGELQAELEKLEGELQSIDLALRAGDFSGARDRSEEVSREAVRLQALAHGGSPATR
jgi:hypothetical protein